MQYPATTITSFWFDLIHWAVGVLALHHDINVVLPICSEVSWSSTGGGDKYCPSVLDRQVVTPSYVLDDHSVVWLFFFTKFSFSNELVHMPLP